MKIIISLLLVLLVMPFVVAEQVSVDVYITNGSNFEELEYGGAFLFTFHEQRHNVVILKATNESVKIRISPEMIDLTLNVTETKEVDLDNNGLNDFSVHLSATTEKNNQPIGGRFIFTILEGPTCELTCQEVYEDNYDIIFLNENKHWNEFCEYEGADDEGRWIYNRDKCYKFQEIPAGGAGGPLTCDTYDKESQCFDSILGNCIWVDNNCVEEIIPVPEEPTVEPEPVKPQPNPVAWIIAAVVVVIGIILIVAYQKKKNKANG